MVFSVVFGAELVDRLGSLPTVMREVYCLVEPSGKATPSVIPSPAPARAPAGAETVTSPLAWSASTRQPPEPVGAASWEPAGRETLGRSVTDPPGATVASPQDKSSDSARETDGATTRTVNSA
ncbi:hypothetical protein IA203_03800 [Corynebacterium wankanglinii]|nr:hypothetical protein IA203_03800 [Corynebacterium wankanglinii]